MGRADVVERAFAAAGGVAPTPSCLGIVSVAWSPRSGSLQHWQLLPFVCLTILAGIPAMAPTPVWTGQDDTASEGAEAARQPTALDSPWRRTAQGWQRNTDWPKFGAAPTPAKAVPAFHPGLLAAFILLVSLGALLAAEQAPPSPEPRVEGIEQEA